MHSRKTFLQQTGALALGALLLPKWGRSSSAFLPKNFPPTGIQLYTLSNLMAEDPRGTLEKVAAIGYKELETAATQKGYYYGYQPKEFAALAKQMGLHWRSQHVMGAPFNPSRMQNNRQTTPQDTARARQMADRMKAMSSL